MYQDVERGSAAAKTRRTCWLASFAIGGVVAVAGCGGQARSVPGLAQDGGSGAQNSSTPLTVSSVVPSGPPSSARPESGGERFALAGNDVILVGRSDDVRLSRRYSLGGRSNVVTMVWSSNASYLVFDWSSGSRGGYSVLQTADGVIVDLPKTVENVHAGLVKPLTVIKGVVYDIGLSAELIVIGHLPEEGDKLLAQSKRGFFIARAASRGGRH